MKLHRFFVEKKIPQSGEFSVVNEILLNQWRNVLRMEAGDKLVVFDGGGDEVFGEIVSLTKKEALLKVIERNSGLTPTHDVTLCMALIKKDNFELVLEKATELGVTCIIPVECARSEKKGINRERSEKILREAAEQSGRATVPTLGNVENIQLLGRPSLPEGGLVVFDPRGKLSAREFFAARPSSPLSVLIGPEGGFTEEEIAMFHTRNIPIVSTGSQTLRAETAAIVALTLALVQ